MADARSRIAVAGSVALLAAGSVFVAPVAGLAAADGLPPRPVTLPAPASTPIDRWPGVATAYALARDGELIWGAELDRPHAPASLAKLLTALVLLDEGWRPQAPVAVSAAAARVVGSRVGLRAGERLRADDALTAMLVRSANDACVALVEHAAGSMVAFRPRLAAAAARFGLTHSSFVDPCGLDAPGQHSTARDLLRLADVAIARPEIAQRARLASARLSTLGGRELAFDSTNALLGRAPGAIGLKTGFTTAAGRCLIAVAELGSRRVVLVMLGATPERWSIASGMLAQALNAAVPVPVRAESPARGGDAPAR
jgi:D-alanyl-D-alanine carboxypeptidase (penicillin-binding protein 5/6)